MGVPELANVLDRGFGRHTSAAAPAVVAAAVGRPGGPARIDRVVMQVGGGAFASSIIAGFQNARAAAVDVPLPRFDTLQTRGAYPLARAHERVAARVAAARDIRWTG